MSAQTKARGVRAYRVYDSMTTPLAASSAWVHTSLKWVALTTGAARVVAIHVHGVAMAAMIFSILMKVLEGGANDERAEQNRRREG